MLKFIMIVLLLVVLMKLRRAGGQTMGQKADAFNHGVRMHILHRVEKAEERYNQAYTDKKNYSGLCRKEGFE